MPGPGVDTLLAAYPRIFFACHRRHRRDPATQRLLSESQARVLDHLDQVQAISLTDLARHLGVTAGTMSLAVTRLVGRGYVKRRRDPTDSRRVRLWLTPAGARVKEAGSVLEPDLVAQMLARLSEPELQIALQGLTLLARAADQTARERGPGDGAAGWRAHRPRRPPQAQDVSEAGSITPERDGP